MEVKVELGDFTPQAIKLLEAIGATSATQVFPHLMAALNDGARMYQQKWRQFATGTPIPGTTRTINSSGPYARSIQVDESNPIEKTIFTDYPAHKWIEDGAPETDLKPGILKGPRSRPMKSKPGGRYNIIPFRHGVPKALRNPMPVRIYNLMLQETERVEQTEGMRRRGVRAVLPAGEGGDPKTKITQNFGTYTWTAGKWEGMRRYDTSSSKATSSEYMTFRIVSSNSDPASWIVPERPPVPIIQAVKDVVTPVVEQLLTYAFQQDLGG